MMADVAAWTGADRPLGDGEGPAGRGRRRGPRSGRRGRCWAAALAAGICGASVIMVTIPLRQYADMAQAQVQALAAEVGLVHYPQAEPFSGTPAVGALFNLNGGALGDHFCSAAVVDSAGRDLLITAAHCVSNTAASSIAFVPGYEHGQTPYGIWPITRIIVDRDWTNNADPDDDVAFLVAGRRNGANIQDVTGGERLGLGAGLPAGQLVSVIGYPETSDAPIRCQNRVTEFNPAQLEFECGGYTDGTSGSPLLENVSSSTGLGTVIGVIGGYEQGGYTAGVSYAARFDPLVANLYQTAAAPAAAG